MSLLLLRVVGACGIDAAEFGGPMVEAEGEADVARNAGESLENERSGVDQ